MVFKKVNGKWVEVKTKKTRRRKSTAAAAKSGDDAAPPISDNVRRAAKAVADRKRREEDAAAGGGDAKETTWGDTPSWWPVDFLIGDEEEPSYTTPGPNYELDVFKYGGEDVRKRQVC